MHIFFSLQLLEKLNCSTAVAFARANKSAPAPQQTGVSAQLYMNWFIIVVFTGQLKPRGFDYIGTLPVVSNQCNQMMTINDD